jgi:hypothetical protein
MARITNKFRAVLSLMCHGLPSTDDNSTDDNSAYDNSKDDKSETEDNESQVRKRFRTKSTTTQGYARNTLMGLPTELRAIIYKFALQDIIDTIVNDSNSVERIITYEAALRGRPVRVNNGRSPLRRRPRRLGGLALPLTNRTIRKESLDVYGPLVKRHSYNLWRCYIDVLDMMPALDVSRDEMVRHMEALFEAGGRWHAVECLQRVINCMYIKECYVRGYYGELHTEARASEWRARAGGGWAIVRGV